MKNLKVNSKFIVSFGAILALFLIAVVVASLGITTARSSYRRFYEEEFEAVNKVKDIRYNQQSAMKELMLGVLAASPEESTKRVSSSDQYMTEVKDDLQWLYSNYTGDLTLLKQFESTMSENTNTRLQVGEYASESTEESNAMATELLLTEYTPRIEECGQILETAVSNMTQTSHDRYDSAMVMLNIFFAVAIIVSVVAFVITLAIALTLTANILAPVRKIEAAMKEVVKGNLSVEVDYESNDEFGSMAHSMHEVTSGVGYIIKDIETILTAMAGGDFAAQSSDRSRYIGDYQKILQAMRGIKSSLNSTMTTLNQSAEQVSSGSDQVSSGAQALSQGATEQASSVEELAASINEISGHINRNAESANEASDKAGEVGEEAGESNRRMQDMLSAMSDISNSSDEIGKIIKTIEDIAFQTNILALNAAVEAARAGAAGKGFAVVADEVRNLAAKSADASKNTAVLIENSLHAVDNGKKIADETAKSLEKVMDGIQEATSMMDSIAKASKEQAEAITQITVGIDQISSVVQTNYATAEESAAASEELSSQAQILKDLVRKFKLEGDSSAPVMVSAPARSSNRESSYSSTDDMQMSMSYGGEKY